MHGKYQIEKKIGEGVSSVVYSAINIQTGERVAIKKINQVFEVSGDGSGPLNRGKVYGYTYCVCSGLSSACWNNTARKPCVRSVRVSWEPRNRFSSARSGGISERVEFARLLTRY